MLKKLGLLLLPLMLIHTVWAATSPSTDTSATIDDGSGIYLAAHTGYGTVTMNGNINVNNVMKMSRANWGVTTGYQFNHKFGLEFDFSSLYSRVHDIETDVFTGAVTNDNPIFVYRLTPAAVGTWSISDNVDFIGKLGVSYFGFDNQNPAPNELLTKAIFTGYIAAGLGYNITQHLALHLLFDDSTLITYNAISANLGIQYRF